MSTSEFDAVAELKATHDRLESRKTALEALDGDVDTVADAYESVGRVLDRWEERATDWDDFEGYVEFRNAISETLESIPEDVPESEAFVEADSHVKTSGVSKSLTSSDFDAARKALEPAREYAEKRSELEEARQQYREAYQAAEKRRRELADRIDDLERLVQLSEADLDAPIEELHEPIAAYNEAVRDAFTEFRKSVSASEFLEFVATASEYPLVGFEAPPERLLEYVRDQPEEHTVGELLEYATYSPSKLGHYVDDADLLKRRVATNRTYLESISADPLETDWPPSEASSLRHRIEELVAVVGRFADEETVAALRAVRRLTQRDDYERLRTAAVADEELTSEERERVESGAIEDELEAARAEYEELGEALENYELE
ncbi:MAG: hypothetical protein ACI8UR_001150 [Natronomonas sp.]|jgi:hypothetical protein|uniref:DUF7118 family protein n=1 Tax=Natronomonas sp. TaxID=2184060 RepID=UPI00398926FF